MERINNAAAVGSCVYTVSAKTSCIPAYVETWRAESSRRRVVLRRIKSALAVFIYIPVRIALPAFSAKPALTRARKLKESRDGLSREKEPEEIARVLEPARSSHRHYRRR